jgi:hypothetical protein
MFEPGPPEFRGKILHFTAASGEKKQNKEDKMIRCRIKDVIKWRIGKWSD